MAGTPDPRSVFLNVPYDSQYERGILGAGTPPSIASEPSLAGLIENIRKPRGDFEPPEGLRVPPVPEP